MNGEISSTKERISKKKLKTLPVEVAEAVKRLADDYGIKSLVFKAVTPECRITAGEGCRYELIVGAQAVRAEVVAEHNVGAAGVTHQIGREIHVPVGGFLIEISYYKGYWMTLYNVQENPLDWPGNVQPLGSFEIPAPKLPALTQNQIALLRFLEEGRLLDLVPHGRFYHLYHSPAHEDVIPYTRDAGRAVAELLLEAHALCELGMVVKTQLNRPGCVRYSLADAGLEYLRQL